MASMAQSLKDNGQIQPIVVRRPDDHDDPEQIKGKTWVLVAGGRRVGGAIMAGWESIRAEDIGTLSPFQRMKIELEENLQREEMHFADVSETKLRLHELYLSENPEHQITDTAIAIGESTSNVSRDLALAQAIRKNPSLRNASSKKAAHQAVKMEEHATALQLQMTNRGYDVSNFQSRLATADARDWLRQQPDGSVDLLATDAPYGIDYFDLPVGEDLSRYDDSRETTKDLLVDVVPHLLRITNEMGWLVIMAGWEGGGYVRELVSSVCVNHFEYQRVTATGRYCHKGGKKVPCRWLTVPPKPWIWYRPNSRNNSMHPDLHAQNQWEPIWVFNRGNGKIFNDERKGNVLVHEAVYDDRIHEMQKPVPLWQDIIERFTMRGARVADPFFGSGSTLAAAASLGREFAGCDSNESMRGPALGHVSLYYKGAL
jgi:ParB/RepB/Spo0J family partition protein